jgi:DNA-binding NarL/FixJ family response regulator
MKILVVDDHPLIREALQQALPELESEVTVLDAGTPEEAEAAARAHPELDLVLLDLSLGEASGFEVLSALRERFPALPVVVLSAVGDRETILKTLDLGAMGFISKNSSSRVLLGALRLVLSGGVYLPPEVLAHRSLAEPAPAATTTTTERWQSALAKLDLTERQMQVLKLVIQGKPNKLIARELEVAEGTVKIHVTAILKALNVANRTQAILALGKLGLGI